MQDDWKTLPVYKAALIYRVTARTIFRWRKIGRMPTRQRRTEEYKKQVVTVAIRDGVVLTSKKTGHSRDTIYRWIKDFRGR